LRIMLHPLEAKIHRKVFAASSALENLNVTRLVMSSSVT
jgi:hypothetical protein